MNPLIGKVIGYNIQVSGEFREEANEWKPFAWNYNDIPLLSDTKVLSIVREFERMSTSPSNYRELSLYVSEIIEMPPQKVSLNVLMSELSKT